MRNAFSNYNNPNKIAEEVERNCEIVDTSIVLNVLFSDAEDCLELLLAYRRVNEFTGNNNVKLILNRTVFFLEQFLLLQTIKLFDTASTMNNKKL